MAELVGRMPVVTTLRELDKDALVKILTTPKNAIVKKYKELFKLDNVELEFDDMALKKNARKRTSLHHRKRAYADYVYRSVG